MTFDASGFSMGQHVDARVPHPSTFLFFVDGWEEDLISICGQGFCNMIRSERSAVSNI